VPHSYVTRTLSVMLMSYYTTHFVSYNKYTDAKGMTDGKWGN